MSTWIACAVSWGVLAACVRPPAPASAPGLGDTAAFERAVRDGRTRFNAEDYAASVAGWQRALTANPGDGDALYWLARASLRAGQPAAAVARCGGSPTRAARSCRSPITSPPPRETVILKLPIDPPHPGTE